MKSVIFYFTGTGNSLWVAKKISANLGNTDLVRLPVSTDFRLDQEIKRVGLIFPVIMFGLPRIIEEFISTWDFPQDACIFVVATCGGMPFASIVRAQELFRTRGMDLSIGLAIRVVNNCTSLGPAPDDEKQRSRFRKAAEKIDELCRKLTQGESFIEKGNRALNWYFTGILHEKAKVLIPCAARYFYTEESCNGCGICEKVCPAGNITLRSSKPSWGDRCEQCYGCLQWCPEQSIQVKSKKTKGRRRYHHPEIAISEIMKA